MDDNQVIHQYLDPWGDGYFPTQLQMSRNAANLPSDHRLAAQQPLSRLLSPSLVDEEDQQLIREDSQTVLVHAAGAFADGGIENLALTAG